MATLDWDGLVFYDQQIKKHIENKLVDAGISKDELDKILDKYASKTYVADEIAKATTGIDLTIYATKTFVTDEIAKSAAGGTVDLTGYAKTSDVDVKLNNYVKKNDAFSGSYNDLADKPIIPNVTGKADKTYVDTELAKKANKSELFSGSYNDLTDKPNIPNVSNLATKTELNNNISSTKHITDDERTKWNGYNDTINTMKTNFEDGVNTIYNAVVAKGVTPLDKSPSNVAKAIESLVIKEKGQLLLTFKSNNSYRLPAPKFNDDNSYNYTCEDTDNGDGTFTRNIYGAKEINQICFYQDKNKDWFKSLEYTTNIKIVSAENMFYLCSNLESVNLNNIDTSECKNFESMFNNCSSLTSLYLSNFNTSKVINMLYMFNNCTSLTSLDLSNFNTSKVTGMSYMFNNCTSLTSLDLSNFDTSKVDSMSGMFQGCSSLTSLDLSNFNTENVQYVSKMFNKVPSTCTIYVDKTKFTKTETHCGFTGTFTDVSQRG